MSDASITIRCPCGTYLRSVGIYSGQAFEIARIWLQSHHACSDWNKERSA